MTIGHVPDPFLSALLETRCWHLPQQALADPANWLAALPAGPAFVDARVTIEDVAATARLLAAGFLPVETAIELVCEREDFHQRSATEHVHVRPAVPGDSDSISALARQAFEFSRFHLDPLIPDARADAVKAAWANNGMTGERGDRAWVGLWRGQAAGFLIGMRRDDEFVIDLIGVDRASRGHGVGHALVSILAQEGLPLRAGTQAANRTSIRFYEELGFRFDRATLTLHLHRV